MVSEVNVKLILFLNDIQMDSELLALEFCSNTVYILSYHRKKKKKKR